MTKEQTRKLGIEFERRIMEVNPMFEGQLKLDTDTIYSFLNEFQQQYIRSLCVNDTTNNGKIAASSIVQDQLKSLVKRVQLKPVYSNTDTDNGILFKAPQDYYLYIRSNSVISSNYRHDNITPSQMIPNVISRQIDVSSMLTNAFNNNNIIRTPIVLLEETKDNTNIKVIHDKFTKINQLDLTYYRCPYKFNVINYDDSDTAAGATHSKCELPYSCFDDIVSGAVDMYLTQYKYKLSSGSKQKQQTPNNNSNEEN